ncbi:MAG: hypothetical protein ACRCVT_05060 [Leadbetterella sp.]
METRKTHLIFAVLMLAFFVNSYAQKSGLIKNMRKKQLERWNTEEYYKYKSYNPGLVTQQNTNFGRNIYLGPQLSIISGNQSIQKNYIYSNRMTSGISFLSSDTLSGQGFINFNIHQDLSLLKRKTDIINYGGNFRWFANTRLGTGFQNNAFGGEYGADIGPSISLDTKPKHKKYSIEASANLALFGYIRSFPTNILSVFGNQQGGFRFINKYQRISTSMFVNFQASKRFKNRSLRVGYTWDFKHLDMEFSKDLYLGQHNLVFIGSINRIK